MFRGSESTDPAASHFTYLITVRNLTKAEVGIEARFAVFDPEA